MEAADDQDEDVRRLIEGGAEFAGAAAGAALSLVGGPVAAVGGAAAGVALTRSFKRIGSELQRRFLADRQRVRIGGAYAIAADRVDERLRAGDVPRQDGFFTGGDGRAPAEELLEGVLLAAGDSYEERKVPFLGLLYAAIAFDETITPAQGNYLIRQAQELTFRQLAVMAVVREGDARSFPEATGAVGEKWLVCNDNLAIEVDELERRGFIHRGEYGATHRRGGMTFADASSLSIDTLTLTGPGDLMYRVMGLKDVSSEARAEVMAELELREPPKD